MSGSTACRYSARTSSVSGSVSSRTVLLAKSSGTRCSTPGRVLRFAVRAEKKTKQSFKWNPAYNRWEKDTKNTLDFGNSEFDPTVVPKSGEAYTLWPMVHSELKDRKLKSLSNEEALKRQKRGAVIVDVREERQFNAQHIEGAVNVPLFRPVMGNSPFDIAKKLAMAAFAMQATERNPAFKDLAKEVLPKNKDLIVVCAIGGTLDTVVKRETKYRKVEYSDPERAFGRESRSLKACFELYEAGFKKVNHLSKGLNQWRSDDFPMFYD